MEKPKRPLLTGNEKMDEIFEEGYQCEMALYIRAKKQAEKELIEYAEQLLTSNK